MTDLPIGYRFIGGPADGQLIALEGAPDGAPASVIHFAIPWPIDWGAPLPPGEEPSFKRAEYERQPGTDCYLFMGIR